MSTDAASSSRNRVPLRAAWAEFWRHPSPWIISTALLAALTARLIVGDWAWTDALLPLIMLAMFPFVEWMIHVCILHWRPKTVAGHTIDPLLSRKHRAHHANPREIPLIFIPWQVLLWLVPVLAAIGFLAFPRTGLGLTFLVMITAIGFAYEWTHYLIHSDYQPKSRYYRKIWRHHRLHHYKNEHYWFTVTTVGTTDRLLRTEPDPKVVEVSQTANNLHGLR